MNDYRRDASPVLPVYLMCDTSASMNSSRKKGGKPPIEVLNESIVSLFSAIARRPATTVDAHLCVISFNTTARCEYRLSDVYSGVTLTTLKAQGFTYLAPALKLFEERLDSDEKQRFPRKSYRPVAFILTDGQPTDGETAWRPVLQRLAQRSLPPRIVPCALDTPNDGVIAPLTASYGVELGSLTKKIITDGDDVAERITSLFALIAKTLNLSDDTAGFTEAATYEQRLAVMDSYIEKAFSRKSRHIEKSFEEYLNGYV